MRGSCCGAPGPLSPRRFAPAEPRAEGSLRSRALFEQVFGASRPVPRVRRLLRGKLSRGMDTAPEAYAESARAFGGNRTFQLPCLRSPRSASRAPVFSGTPSTFPAMW
ncbi:MAG: hypothetical protein MZU97_08130 [Bacillus subtilis]|nr:hypothetical protein [Bacillus subtilis]